MGRSRRRYWVWGAAVIVLLCLTGVLAAYFFYGAIAERVFRSKVVPKLESRLGRKVSVAQVLFTRGTGDFKDLVIYERGDSTKAWITVDELHVVFEPWSPLSGPIKIEVIEARDATLALTRNPEGATNVDDLIEILKAKRPASGASTGTARRFTLDTLSLKSGSVTLVDELSGNRASASEVHFDYILGEESIQIEAGATTFETVLGPSATLEDVKIQFDKSRPIESARMRVGNGSVELWREMTLTGVQGELSRGDEEGALSLDFSGGYGGALGKLWTAKGWIAPAAKAGQVTLKAERFTFDRLASVLTDSAVVDFENTSLDTSVELSLKDGVGTVLGDLSLSGLNVSMPRLAGDVMRDLSVDGHLQASWHSGTRTLTLDDAKAKVRGVDYLVSGQVELPGGSEQREFPHLILELSVPKVSCQTMMKSIPKEFAPKFDRFKLRGDFEATIEVDIDWGDLEETVFSGDVGIDGCKVLDAPYIFDLKRLETPFKYEILVGPDEWKRVTLGEPETFVPLTEMSPHIVNAFMTQEDSGFDKHRGFITKEFRQALIKNLEAGREEGKWILFKWGASSITMQTVKNIFLSRDKTISRKLQELFLTWHIEKTLDKDRIMEIYVNAIEYGPGVYGIKAATEFYFAKEPYAITPIEAAFLASLLPAPRRFYYQYCRDRLGRTKKVGRILSNMHDRERLSDEEYEAAMLEHASETPLTFNPIKKREVCRRPVDW